MNAQPPPPLISNLRPNLCYTPTHYDRLMFQQLQILWESPVRLFETLTRALFREVLNVKVRTLNERNNHIELSIRVARRSGITYRWCKPIEAPSFQEGE